MPKTTKPSSPPISAQAAKKKKTTQLQKEVVYAEKGEAYTRTQLKELTEEKIKALAGRDSNCKFYVLQTYREVTFGPNKVMVCYD